MKNATSDYSVSSGLSIDVVNELTPISVKEAERIIGKSTQYSTSEAIANAILDFTAIARAYFRNVPKYTLQEYNKV